MKLSECKIGEVVVRAMSTDDKETAVVGHVVGLESTLLDRAVPVVKWANGTTCGIHHDNIRLLK